MNDFQKDALKYIAKFFEEYKHYADEANGIAVMQKDALERIASALDNSTNEHAYDQVEATSAIASAIDKLADKVDKIQYQMDYARRGITE